MSNPDRLINDDGSMQRPEGIILPVSLGLPYIIAELIRKPVETAVLRSAEPYGSTVKETWVVRDQPFMVAQDERFVRAERSRAIGSITIEGTEILIYQKRPPLFDSPIRGLVYSSH
jgi:hypothetical protein